MTVRCLVVDDVAANVKLLEARLTADGVSVATARSGEEAVEACRREPFDVVLLDVMMPGMDGFEACRRIKSGALPGYVPVVLVTALDQAADRVAGYEAGADDFLTKPVDDLALITRVRNLARLKRISDEIAAHGAIQPAMQLEPRAGHPTVMREAKGRILLVDDNSRSNREISAMLAGAYDVRCESGFDGALDQVRQQNVDLLLFGLGKDKPAVLDFCTEVRALTGGRDLPIIALTEDDARPRLLSALSRGVNDYLLRPIDRHELHVRVRTQLRYKRQTDVLRVGRA